MSRKICENCGKTYMGGHKVSHSKQRSKRAFQPNLHKTSLMINGVKKKMLLCTRCIRILKKQLTSQKATKAVN